ncbi:MAG TPA: SLC13 family permease, partial [Alphaproteobacteria bacterium]|nr:SLC13 family permease [Alphaproteobacteria bacterium]
VIEWMIAPLVPFMKTTGAQILVLVSTVAVLSAFMKNIGALAIFIPIAMQIARRTELPASRLLMPMSFGSLLGGLLTLIGTSPNIIVSRVRSEITGTPFEMFDFFPVGAGIALAGVAFLVVGWRLLPRTGRSRKPPEELFKVEGYVSEARVPAGSAIIGKTVQDLETLSNGDITVSAIIREQFRRYVPSARWTIYEGDVLVLEGDPHALQKIVERAGLELVGDKEIDRETTATDELVSVEAVVTSDSPMVGRSLAEIRLRQRYQVNVLALSRRRSRMRTRLRRVRFQPGDVIVLQGQEDSLSEAFVELGLLPLAARNVQLGERRRAFVPVAILAVAMIAIAVDVVPATIGFFGAATLLVLFRAVSLRELYETVEWPIIVLLGCLIPVSDAIRTTGGTELIAGWLSHIGQLLPAYGALTMVMVAAMLVTPFLNNAATVLVMGPVAASLAVQLGLGVDAFLMAVAIGAACDFLTPIGHQCNTLVMGPGGYSFTDYWRLGLPLSFIVVLVGVPLIMLFWPI